MAIKGTDTDSRAQSYQRAVAEAEQDAQSRINLARRRARDAEVESDQKISQIQDQYVKESTHVTDRNELALLNQRQKGYEVLLADKRAADQERARQSREQSTTLQSMRDTFHAQSTSLEKEGAEKTAELIRRNTLMEEYARKQHSQEMDAMRALQAEESAALKNQQEEAYQAEKLSAEDQTHQMRRNHQLLTETTKERFEDQFADHTAKNQQSLAGLDAQASAQLKAAQEKYTRKLAAYSSRASDPFYQPLDLKARIRETDDAFIIRAAVPEHERDSLSVSVRGNQLVLSGQRRSKEQIEREPGRVASTSSFQAFSETIPLTHPVDAKSLYREFDGDDFVVTIPKASIYAKPALAQRGEAPQPARAQRPQFPGNLPEPRPKPGEEVSTDPLATAERANRKKSGRTLA